MGGAVSAISAPIQTAVNAVTQPVKQITGGNRVVGAGLGGLVGGVAGAPLGAALGGDINVKNALSGAAVGGLLMGPMGAQVGGTIGGLGLGGYGEGSGGGGGGDFSNPFGRPNDPTFESQIDPATGLLRQQYQQKDQLNTQGLEAMRKEALRDPSQMSQWRQLAQTQAMGNLSQQQGNQLAQAQSGLAAAGGLSQGARERMQQTNMQQGLMGQQGIWNQMAMQDEQKRMQMLGQLPGQELAAAQYKSGIGGGNIQGALDEINRKRAFDMARYQEQMRAWGAGQTAAAMPQPQDRGLIGNMFESIF